MKRNEMRRKAGWLVFLSTFLYFRLSFCSFVRSCVGSKEYSPPRPLLLLLFCSVLLFSLSSLLCFGVVWCVVYAMYVYVYVNVNGNVCGLILIRSLIPRFILGSTLILRVILILILKICE